MAAAKAVAVWRIELVMLNFPFLSCGPGIGSTQPTLQEACQIEKVQ